MKSALGGAVEGDHRSRGRHVFDESQPVYIELRKVHEVRRKHLALRRGRQFLRQISGNGLDFGFPQGFADRMKSILAWSRIFNDVELLCAINTDAGRPATTFVTIDNDLHAAGDRLTCLYSSDAASIGHTIAVEPKNGKAVSLTISASGFVIYG